MVRKSDIYHIMIFFNKDPTVRGLPKGSKEMKISVGAMAAACSLLLVSAANAADVGVTETSADWSGFYVGAFGGYGAAAFDGITDSNKIAFDLPEKTTIMSGEMQWGFTYGGYAGFNFDNNGFLMGLELDLGGGDFSETATDDNGNDIDTHTVNWVGSFRGRLGATYNDTLVYMTGGLAMADSTFESIDDKGDVVDENSGEADLVSFGYVVGAGIEQRFHERISLRLEGLYYGAMDEHTFKEKELTDEIDAGDYAKIDGMMQFRAGIGYHF
jgi:outer membrane immunogenic protein